MKIEIHFEIEDEGQAYKYYGKELDSFIDNMRSISETFAPSLMIYED